jgi:hypothetical protein
MAASLRNLRCCPQDTNALIPLAGRSYVRVKNTAIDLTANACRDCMRSWHGWPTSTGMQQIETLLWRPSGAASALQGCQAKGLQHDDGAVACSD